MNHYVRKHDPKEPVPKGWSVVTIPEEGTYQVDNLLATELESLVRRGQVQTARTLLSWFDPPRAD